MTRLDIMPYLDPASDPGSTPQRFSVKNCKSSTSDKLQTLRTNKKKVFSHYGQQFTRNAKNGFDGLKLIWSGTFAMFNPKPLWF